MDTKMQGIFDPQTIAAIARAAQHVAEPQINIPLAEVTKPVEMSGTLTFDAVLPFDQAQGKSYEQIKELIYQSFEGHRGSWLPVITLGPIELRRKVDVGPGPGPGGNVTRGIPQDGHQDPAVLHGGGAEQPDRAGGGSGDGADRPYEPGQHD